jgi:AraC-like DNA-binding protein
MPADRPERDEEVPLRLPPCGYWANRGQGRSLYPQVHRHAGCELVLIHRGHGQCLTPKRAKTFSPGQVLLVDARQEHSLRVYGSAFVRTIILFDPAILSPTMTRSSRLWDMLSTAGVLKAEPCATAHARLNGWLDGLFAALAEDRADGDAVVSAYIQLILVEFDRHTSLCQCGIQYAGTADPTVVGAVLWYIEHHLAETVTLEAVARELGISPRHLERRFKEVTGKSLRAFWIEERMEQAATLLRAGPSGVAEVARMVGYRSPHAFARAFKRQFGVAPSALLAPGTDGRPPAAGGGDGRGAPVVTAPIRPSSASDGVASR